MEDNVMNPVDDQQNDAAQPAEGETPEATEESAE